MITPGVVTGMTTHAALYARQSEARANGSEVSTADQISHGKDEAKKRNVDSITVYEDLGISAFSGKERPDFERMLNDCRSGRINMIIVYYVSRFSRMDPLDAIPIVTELLNLGVTIVSVTEGEFRRGNLMDLIHLILRLDASHNESKNKSDAVSSAKRSALALGGFVGGKAPYGFKLKPVTKIRPDGKPQVIQYLEPIKEEFAVLRAIWVQIKTHMHEVYDPKVGGSHPGSLSGICGQLNAGTLNGVESLSGKFGIPTRGQTVGKKTKQSAWNPKTLKRILSDPRIAGFAATPVYARKPDGTLTTRIEEYRIARDPETMEPIRPYEAAIDPADWYELQEWLAGRGRGQGLSRGESLLAGMQRLYCECGSVMTSARTAYNKKTNRKGHGSYRCRRPKGRVYPGQHAGECTIGQVGLDAYVAQRIFAVVRTAEDDPDSLCILAEAAKRFAKLQEDPEVIVERRQVLAERADAMGALETLYDDKDAGDYDGPVGKRRFRERKAKLEATIEAADFRLVALDKRAAPALPVTQWLPEGNEGDPLGEGSWWAGASMEERREFVKLFVERIEIKKAFRHAGQGVPIEDRVSLTFVGTTVDEDEDHEADEALVAA